MEFISHQRNYYIQQRVFANQRCIGIRLHVSVVVHSEKTRIETPACDHLKAGLRLADLRQEHSATMHASHGAAPLHFELGSVPVARTFCQQRPAPALVAVIAQSGHCWHVPISCDRRSAALCRSSLAPQSLEQALEELPPADSDSFWLAPGQHALPGIILSYIKALPRNRTDLSIIPVPRCVWVCLSMHIGMWSGLAPWESAEGLIRAPRPGDRATTGELSHINRLDYRTKPMDIFRCFGCKVAECQVLTTPPSPYAASFCNTCHTNLCGGSASGCPSMTLNRAFATHVIVIDIYGGLRKSWGSP